jgi:asparagine synthase (glutamine-hydrolysing)
VEDWIAPRAGDIARRLGDIEAVRRVQPDAAAAFTAGAPGVRWPLLFFALWSRIHLDGASPAEALASVVGAI